MGNDQYYEPGDEQESAEDRIRRIREGGGTQPQPEPVYEEEPVVSAGRASRADELRQEISGGRGSRAAAASSRATTSSRASSSGGNRSRQALLVIGGVVAIGVIVVLVIVLISALGGGGGGISLPFGATDTPTPTATSTSTPMPTETPTATPTKEAPPLALPPLTCIFQSGVGCYDYCQAPENAGECNSARDFVTAQGADAEAWLQCIASGPGPNVGNPQKCLEEAWRIANP